MLAIKNKMAAQFEYRGGLRNVPETVFFQILRQQMRTRKSNMKKLIESGGPLSPCVKNAYVNNFKRLIARTDKIAEATRMKAAWQTVQTLSYSGRSERKVRSKLVSNFVYKTFVNEYVTTYSDIMTLDSYMLPSYDFG